MSKTPQKITTLQFIIPQSLYINATTEYPRNLLFTKDSHRAEACSGMPFRLFYTNTSKPYLADRLTGQIPRGVSERTTISLVPVGLGALGSAGGVEVISLGVSQKVTLLSALFRALSWLIKS